MFEKSGLDSYEDFLKSLFLEIVRNPSTKSFFVSIPEVYDHCLIVQLFHEIAVELSDPQLMQSALENAFTKKKSKSSTKLTLKKEIVDFVKSHLSAKASFSKSPLDISVFNTAALLGKLKQYPQYMLRSL